MENDDVKLIKSSLSLSLRLFNDVTPFSKFLLGRIINCYSII